MTSTEILSELKNVNFTTEQATAITKIFEERQQMLATKSDVDSAVNSAKNEMNTKIDSAKIELKADIAIVEGKVELIEKEVESVKRDIRELRAEISKVKYDLVRWIVGALIFNVGLVASLMFAMFKLFLDK